MIKIDIAKDHKNSSLIDQIKIILKMNLPDEEIILEDFDQTINSKINVHELISAKNKDDSTVSDTVANHPDLFVIPAYLLPSDIDTKLTLAAVLKRENPAESVITINHLTFKEIPSGNSLVIKNYASLIQLKQHRSDLKYHHWYAPISEYQNLLKKKKVFGFVADEEICINQI